MIWLFIAPVALIVVYFSFMVFTNWIAEVSRRGIALSDLFGGMALFGTFFLLMIFLG